MSKLNLFATVLTYAAPSSNYRGESEESRTVLQTIPINGKNHAIISPDSMRNALRDLLTAQNLPCNRSRLHDEGQPAVEFIELPNPDNYIDDYFFGYMVAKTEFASEMKKLNRKSKRDSVIRVNVAVSVSPYKNSSIFHQSPLHAGKSPWKNDNSSSLLHREVIHTAYQYPFALAGRDCESKPEWTKALLKSIGQLTNVAGGHARSYYEMSPKSIVARLTPSLVAGFDTYGFDEHGDFPELDRINEEDLPASEFWVGGELARRLSITEPRDFSGLSNNGDIDESLGLNNEKNKENHHKSERDRLEKLGVHFCDNPQKLLKDIGEALLKTE